MPSAFISRDLAPHADFRRLLQEHGWAVTGQSLVHITPLPFPAVPPCDWIFFSSQNGVRHFFSQAGGLADWTDERARQVRWAAIGASTARSLQAHTGQVDFTGTGAPLGTAAQFRAAFLPPSGKNTWPMRVLFAGAAQAERTLSQALQAGCVCLHLPVYDNVPVEEAALRQEDVLVFTSPMNVAAYFRHHQLLAGQQVVAIGPTTQKVLCQWGVTTSVVATQPNEADMANTVLKL